MRLRNLGLLILFSLFICLGFVYGDDRPLEDYCVIAAHGAYVDCR